MNFDDGVLFYGSSAVVLLLNIVLLVKRKNYGIISLIVQAIYNAYFIHGVYYDSAEGTGLVWWFYLIMINCLHFVIIIALLVNNYIIKKIALTGRSPM
jgi:hypothetical protein